MKAGFYPEKDVLLAIKKGVEKHPEWSTPLSKADFWEDIKEMRKKEPKEEPKSEMAALNHSDELIEWMLEKNFTHGEFIQTICYCLLDYYWSQPIVPFTIEEISALLQKMRIFFPDPKKMFSEPTEIQIQWIEERAKSMVAFNKDDFRLVQQQGWFSDSEVTS